MEWNVYYDDSTRKKIIKWNIFDHTKFRKDVEELLNQDLSKQDFVNNLVIPVLSDNTFATISA